MGLLDDLKAPSRVCAFHIMLQKLPDDEREAVLDYVEQLRQRTNTQSSTGVSISKLYNVLKQNNRLVGKNQIRDVINHACSCEISS